MSILEQSLKINDRSSRLSAEILPMPKKTSHNINRAKYYKIQIHCEACQRTYNKVQWYKHYKTKKHKRNLLKIKKNV